MNKVLAIVVTYNRLEMLKKCVEHLQAQVFPCDILIVDNASTDGTRAWAAGLNSKDARNLMKGIRGNRTRQIENSEQKYLAGRLTREYSVGNETREYSVGNEPQEYSVGNEPREYPGENEPQEYSVGNEPQEYSVGNEPREYSVGNEPRKYPEGYEAREYPVRSEERESLTEKMVPEQSVSEQTAGGKRKGPKVVPVDVWTQDTVLSTATVLWDDDSMHRIIYENTGENLGGAGGFNYGMRRAVEMGYEFAWAMDDDAFAEPDCLEKLMQAAGRLREFGFLTSAVLWKDGTLCKMNYQRKYPTPKKRSERHLLESDLNKELVRIQSATFVSALFPTKIIQEVGLPIKEFFIWCDDIEFTRRITLKYKHPAYVVTSSRITHYIQNNEGTNISQDDVKRIPRYNYAFRNENYMYRQYGLKGFSYYLLVIIYNTFHILAYAPSHKGARLKVVWKNLFTGLTFNPGIERIQ